MNITHQYFGLVVIESQRFPKFSSYIKKKKKQNKAHEVN